MKMFWLYVCMAVQGTGYAQPAGKEALLQGRIRCAAPESPPGAYELVLPGLKLGLLTDQQGRFSIAQIPYGNHLLLVRGTLQRYDTFRVAVDLDTVQLGDLRVPAPALGGDDVLAWMADVPGLTEEEALLPVIGSGAGDATGAALRAWSTLGYRFRGYARDQERLFLDGLELNDGGSGVLFRMMATLGTGAVTGYSLDPGALPPGLPGTATSVYATAADQRRQTRIIYSRSDGSWSNRIRLSHATGMTSKGWAFALSGGYCGAGEGYVPGTSYREYSLYAALSRRIGGRSMLHLSTLIMPLESGQSVAATAEAINLAGTPYYNPAWGYQEGRQRSARIARMHTPLALLHYVYKPDTFSCINLVALFRAGNTGNTLLDWYDAPDPRPDYYRNMPSAYSNDPATAARIGEAWRTDTATRQLDWAKMYAANLGNGLAALRRRSGYVLAEDMAGLKQLSLAAYGHKQYVQLRLRAGLNYDRLQTTNYRKLLDLLGGDYFVNVNRFAEQAYAGTVIYNQNDLNDPDREVLPGEAYSYRYIMRSTRAGGWLTLDYNPGRLHLFLAGSLVYDAYQREGLYRTGLFPFDSYGPSDKQQYVTWHIHTGIGYSLDKYQSLFINAAAGSTPPAVDDVFIAPRSRNTVVTGGAGTARYRAMEAGYKLHTRRLTGTLTFFTTDRYQLTSIRRFYHEDYRSFVNYVMQGMATRSAGIELALTLRVAGFMSVTAAACKLRAVYRSRPGVRIYKDNDTAGLAASQVAYLKDYYLPGPQSVYMLACDFRLPRYIRAGIRCRAAADNYAAINPARRTDAAMGLVPPGSPQGLRILEQERLPAVFMLDLSAGKTCYLRPPGKHRLRYAALSIDLGVSNLLDRKNAITAAYEQLRFDYKSHDPDRFPNKYRYAYGAVYTLSAGLRF
ncbi:TonB-dependent receptor [Taibaiella chishuiensis]|uniref:TonB-dependent receptor-like protein n=1 Tax=Taibaiella chishuiensis TaxID=1434707 RepID=A0A2P8D493_9BACT|nr:TonB-dependent receptor [Taibaiella chishuiensis]PSK92048.1 TonB-dependent receptor-like protein [Taibaiella chishuiensis]